MVYTIGEPYNTTKGSSDDRSDTDYVHLHIIAIHDRCACSY